MDSLDNSQTVFVDFSVEYSHKFDTITNLKNKLHYFHLTIEKCWLTKTSNENMNIQKVLILNGYNI